LVVDVGLGIKLVAGQVVLHLAIRVDVDEDAAAAKLVLKSNSHISKRQFLKWVHRPREVVE